MSATTDQLKAQGFLIIFSQAFSLSRRSSQAESMQSKINGEVLL